MTKLLTREQVYDLPVVEMANYTNKVFKSNRLKEKFGFSEKGVYEIPDETILYDPTSRQAHDKLYKNLTTINAMKTDLFADDWLICDVAYEVVEGSFGAEESLKNPTEENDFESVVQGIIYALEDGEALSHIVPSDVSEEISTSAVDTVYGVFSDLLDALQGKVNHSESEQISKIAKEMAVWIEKEIKENNSSMKDAIKFVLKKLSDHTPATNYVFNTYKSLLNILTGYAMELDLRQIN